MYYFTHASHMWIRPRFLIILSGLCILQSSTALWSDSSTPAYHNTDISSAGTYELETSPDLPRYSEHDSNASYNESDNEVVVSEASTECILNAQLPTLITPAYQRATQTSKLLSTIHQPNPDDTLEYLLRPVKCTAHGIRCFVKHTYNHPEYTDILPACFAHVTDMCAYASRERLPLSFDERAFTLFHAKLLTCSWVNPYALLVLLEDTPRLVCPRMQQARHADVRALEQTLHDALLNNFQQLKTDPQAFLEDTAHKLYASVHSGSTQDLQRLQYTFCRFLEHALSKLVWDPRDQKSVWESCLMIGEQIYTWYSLGMLPDNRACNTCLWALLGRFAYFIECAGSRIHPATYHFMLDSLERYSHDWVWLQTQELETWITPKSSFLRTIIEQGILKQKASTAGILTDRAF